MFENSDIVGLGSYEVNSSMQLNNFIEHLDNLEMDLGNLIDHLGNLEMEVGNLDDLIVKIGNLVGWGKDFLELKSSFGW